MGVFLSLFDKLEQERLNTEQERLQSERMKNQLEAERTETAIKKGIGIGKIIGLGFLGLFIAAIVVSCSISVLEDEGYFDQYEEQIEEKEPEVQETPQSVKLNEAAVLSKYKITCDKFEFINPYPWKPDKDNELIEAHFIVENLTDDTLEFDEEIVCIADGYQCKENLPPKEMGEELRFAFIKKGLKTQGSLCFQVPTEAKEVIIKVGDYIEIKAR